MFSVANAMHNCLHWQVITREIRKLLDVEDISWNRSITLPPREQRGGHVTCDLLPLRYSINWKSFFYIYWSLFITARCTLVQSAVLRSHVVCLSVYLSVMLVNC